MFRPVIFILALLCCLRVEAQLMPFKNYGIKDGLTDNNVQAVIRDDRGLLWVGTDFGIYWFDGARFYKPPLKANAGQLYITGFYKDLDGSIWIQTFFNGLFKYKNGRFTNYLVNSHRKGAAENSIAIMTQLSANRYLVLTQTYLFFFDGSSFYHFDTGKIGLRAGINSVTRISGNLIVLSTDDGLYYVDFTANRPRLVTHLFPRKRFEKAALIENQLWAIKDKGIICLPFRDSLLKSAKPVPLLSNTPLKDISQGKNGDIWLIANNGSFWDVADTVFKISKGKITTYSRQNGLPENVQQIYPDEEGMVWMANRKGLSMLADEYYSFYSIINGRLNDPVTSLALDAKNNLWAGTISRLAVEKGGDFVFLSGLRMPTAYVSWLARTSGGLLLAGTVSGVLNVIPDRPKRYIDIHSTAFCEGAGQTLWFGGINGEVWRYRNGKLTSLKFKEPVFEMITAMHIAKGKVWIGYRNEGILLCREKGDSLLKVAELSAVNGFADMQIRCCAGDNKGNVFWGTRTTGVYVFSENGTRPFAHISTQNGLNANWIKDIFTDNGTVYLATNNGINMVLGDYRKPLVSYMKIDDDNINRETNCITRAGNIFYIGTNEGILKWAPGNIKKDTVPPQVYLTKVNIQGLSEFSITPYTQNGGEITLPYDKHFISFEFAGISLKNPANIQYRYTLGGQDNTWSPLISHNDVAFDLRPGSYTFKVLAKNADGVWSRHPAVFHFTIKPPFWLSWWFVSIVVITVGAIIYSGYRYNLSKALALELLRNKISTDLHDDIGSTLSSISILSEVAANEKEAKSKRMLAEINERSHLLMEKMDDIVWSISTRNDSVGNLFSRVQQFASTILEAKNIDYEFRIPDKLKTIKLDMQRRQHIYLILKEALNNLIKYSGCTMVCIVAEYSDGLLKLEVTDNGKGFDTSVLSQGNGLLNMKNRTEAMNGKLNIMSETGKGTRVNLVVQIE